MSCFSIQMPLLKVSGLLVLSLFLLGCDSVESEALSSSDCILINAFEGEGHDLLPLAQVFAEERQYESILFHPGNPRYLIKVDGAVVGEISLKIGVGAFGARLAVWIFDDDVYELVDAEFRMFTDMFERHGYEPTACEDVGYRGPVRIVPVENITSEEESDRTDGGGATDSS